MIKPVSKEVMIDVRMLTNPNKFYRVQRCVDISSSRDTVNTIAGSQRPLINNVAVVVNNMMENIAITLQTLKNKCVINVEPAEQNIELVQEQLENVLVNLRDKIRSSYDGVVGLVVGGRAYDQANPFADKGGWLVDEICEFLEKEQIPATKILEQKIGAKANGIGLYSHKNHAVLSGGIINDFGKSDINNPDVIDDVLERSFVIFEESPYAPVKIVDEVLPDKSTNLRFISQ